MCISIAETNGVLQMLWPIQIQIFSLCAVFKNKNQMKELTLGLEESHFILTLFIEHSSHFLKNFVFHWKMRKNVVFPFPGFHTNQLIFYIAFTWTVMFIFTK